MNIKYLLETAPTTVGAITPDVIEIANYLLPYSIGIELECFKGEEFDINNFKNIPDIMHVDIDADEQRFRIPSGIKGLICLYNISETLKKNSLLNLASGAHYHVDCSEMYADITPKLIEGYKEVILKELDTWEYKGSYNLRDFSSGMMHRWLRCQNSFKTIECRIGEMTFDYELLFKRIVHLSNLIRDFKEVVADSLEEDTILVYNQDVEETLRTRTIKI